VTPDWQQFQQQIVSLNARLHKAMARLFTIQHLQLENLNQRLIAPRRLVNTHWQTLDYLTRQLNHAQNNLLKQKRLLISGMSLALDALSPLATLARGYAIATLDDTIVKDAALVPLNSHIHLQLARGALTLSVEKIHHAK
jgi:exodeoxyribonuclease VII large subunit